MKKIKMQNGITMIALVITIIVLLILAAVTINLTIGDRGIFKTAKGAAENYTDEAQREEEELAQFDIEVNSILQGISTGNSGSSGSSSSGGSTETGSTGESRGATITATSTASHTATSIPNISFWEGLEQVAKVISDNYGTEEGKINNTTTEVNVTVNGNNYTLGIGDTATVTKGSSSYQVRILGFNHDKLVDTHAYGETSTNQYAGISFEFVDLLIKSAKMNSSNTNTGGWASCELRTTLNGDTYYGSLENKDQIKKVKKDYIKEYSNASSVTTLEEGDNLWLLSCSEIWSTGYQDGAYGYAITKEGEQYAYYKNINATYSSANNTLKKPSSVAGTSSDGSCWWLRSPGLDTSNFFCYVYSKGNCNSWYTNDSLGVAPGFAI